MNERVEPIPSLEAVVSIQPGAYPPPEQIRESEKSDQTYNQTDRIEISSERKVSEPQEETPAEEVSPEDQARAAEDWYRYGLPQAYQSFEM